MQDTNMPLYLFHRGTNYQAYKLMSPHIETVDGETGWVFRVWAPAARSVSVIGDFNGWDRGRNPMRKISVGVWEAFVKEACEWNIYRYSVEGWDGRVVEKSDPYALHTETPPANASKLINLHFDWTDGDYIARRRQGDIFNQPLNVYEMHVGAWKMYPDGKSFDYRKTADELVPYIKSMHYTHVELMPVTEYPFLGSWGYQCTGMFAPTSRYGDPAGLMYLVNKCHEAGIGVLVDLVTAHFPKDEFGLRRFDGGPLYEYADPRKGEHPEWGTLVYDFGRNEVRSFLISSAMFWVKEYHFDGIRMDAVSSMLYLDYGRGPGGWVPNQDGGNINLEAKSFLQELNNAIHTWGDGALMIAEESTSFPGITKPLDEDGLGFDFKWNMGWMNDTLRYVKSDPLWRKDMHSNMTFGMMYAFSEHFILALSHDEVVHGKGSLIGKQPGYYNDKFGGLMTYLGYMIAHPGKKLIFMGAEIGQFSEWNENRGLDWFLVDQYPTHKGLQKFVADLNLTYLREKALWEQDCSWDGFQWLAVNDSNWNILSWRRIAKDGSSVVALMNFSPMYREGYLLGVPEAGTYRTILNSAAPCYGVGNSLEPGEYHTEDGEINGFDQHLKLNVAPNSVVYLKKE